MLRALIRSRIAAAEKRLGVPSDYLRYMLDTSLAAFLKFVKIMPMANYRLALPVDVYHVARLVATKEEDCGPCVQIEVNLAKQDGVSPAVIRACLNAAPDDMAEPLADVYRFAEGVVRRSGEDNVYRDRIREAYGDQGLVELAMAIAACRVFPTTKRALGFSQSCSAVAVRM